MKRRAPKSSASASAAARLAAQMSRKSKVARARRLVKDGNYPSKKVLEAVARLLARHLG